MRGIHITIHYAIVAFAIMLSAVGVAEQVTKLIYIAVHRLLGRRHGGMIIGLRNVVAARLAGPVTTMFAGGIMLSLSQATAVALLALPAFGFCAFGLVTVYVTIKWAYNMVLVQARESRGATDSKESAEHDQEVPF